MSGQSRVKTTKQRCKSTVPGDAAPSGRWRAPVARRLGAVARNGIRSAPLHNALFVGGILAYGAAFAWYMLDRFDLYDLLRTTLDDAFYYFQTAWHMAGGNFSTFDGGITRTNGYHPFWMFLIVPFYWMFDKVEALYAIRAFEVMLVAGGVALVAGAARVARLPWVLLFGALPTVYPVHRGVERRFGSGRGAVHAWGALPRSLPLRPGSGQVAVGARGRRLRPALGASGVRRHIRWRRRGRSAFWGGRGGTPRPAGLSPCSASGRVCRSSPPAEDSLCTSSTTLSSSAASCRSAWR